MYPAFEGTLASQVFYAWLAEMDQFLDRCIMLDKHEIQFLGWNYKELLNFKDFHGDSINKKTTEHI